VTDVLRIVSGAAAGSEVALDGEFVVGRGEKGRGNLSNDTEISRRHARFHRDGEGHVVVEDMGSTNGTFVNGRRISGPTVLAPGDEIELGATLVRLGGGEQKTRLRATAPRARPAVAPAPPAAPSAPPAAKPAAAGGRSGGATPATRRSERSSLWIDAFALLAAVTVVIVIAIVHG